MRDSALALIPSFEVSIAERSSRSRASPVEVPIRDPSLWNKNSNACQQDWHATSVMYESPFPVSVASKVLMKVRVASAAMTPTNVVVD